MAWPIENAANAAMTYAVSTADQLSTTPDQIQLGDMEPFWSYTVSADTVPTISINPYYPDSEIIKSMMVDIEHLKDTLPEINRRLQESYDFYIDDLI